ncbi:MAG: alpha/beta hydrolase [Ruminococcaceae bacterium]|nr:alpha/beta hydrolase [Oscillospiraceae bacterium]
MFINIDGLNINYVDIGNKNSKNAILLLHGWGSNITLFQKIIDMVSPSMRVVAPDMPGFGESDEPKEPWCVDDYVTFVAKFCKEIDLKDPIVLGHSFGGRVIIKSVTGENPTINPPKIILTDSAGIKPKQSLKSKVNTKMYKMGRAVMSTAPMKKLFPDAVENMRNKRGSADYRTASPVMRATLVNVVNEDLTHLLSEIKQSTLLVWGDKDDATPLSDGQLMEKLIPDSGLVVIEGTGHYAFLEGWYTFSRVLASFLEIK